MSTNITVLKIVHILFWVAFIGLCIKTGSLFVSFMVSLFVNAAGARNLYLGLNLAELRSYDQGYYIFTVSLLIALTGLKAFIAYLIVKFFLIFDLSKPFGQAVTAIFLRVSHVSLGTGILAIVADGFSQSIQKKGIAVPVDWGGNEILFFAGVIYLLALVFEKGTDLQTESDLTV